MQSPSPGDIVPHAHPLLILLAASPALAQPHYEAHLLPNLGGTFALPLAINNRAEMAGQSTRPNQTYEVAVAWLNGQCIELGGSGFSLSGGQGVTDSGFVVGYTDQLGARAIQSTPPGPVTMIPQLATSFSHALAINANQDIVGSYTTSPRPFALRAGVLTPLPLLGGTQGIAYAINNTGTICGWTNLNSGGGVVGVQWINDQPTQLTGGASQTIAYGINDEGWIVGYTSGSPLTTYEASLWTSPTTRQNLGALNGNWNNIAYAINNHRQIVGASGSTAFLWQNNQIHDLNTLVVPTSWPSQGWTVTDARAISDTGLIAAQATHDGQSSAVLLIPTCSADFNHDGDTGTDADIAAFFACLSGICCPSCNTADFNADGDTGTDQDIESFFRVLGGGPC